MTRPPVSTSFPLDAARWLTDPAMLTMSIEQQGALIRLRCFIWMNLVSGGPGRVPLDDEQIVAMAGRAAPGVLALRVSGFERTPEGWSHPGMLLDFFEATEARKRRSEAGRLGGKARVRNIQAMLDENSSNASEMSSNASPEPVEVAVPDRWLEVRAAYPRRDGGQDWRRAEVGYRAALKRPKPLLLPKATPDLILAGTVRYAAWVRATGKEGTELVKQAATFFGRSEHWREEWTVTAASTAPRNGVKPSLAAQQLGRIVAARP